MLGGIVIVRSEAHETERNEIFELPKDVQISGNPQPLDDERSIGELLDEPAQLIGEVLESESNRSVIVIDRLALIDVIGESVDLDHVPPEGNETPPNDPERELGEVTDAPELGAAGESCAADAL